MVQCEMCGAETGSPKTIKVEGAELDVCDNCSDFGTEVKPQGGSGSTSTKYSTSSSSSGSSGSSGGSTGTSRSSSQSRRSDMFDDMDEIAPDYDDRIRNARETTDMSQEDLANELNEKASLIRKLERGDVLPSDEVRDKLEGELKITLTTGGSDEDEDWDGGNSTGEYTLGDVVKRKD